MVAVKITNNSELPIIINSGHFSVASSGQQVKLYSPNEFYNIIKQEKGYYFFWLIGNPTYFNTTPGTITGYNPTTGTLYGTPPVTHYYPIPIGTALAFLNFFTAKAANKRLLADLKQNQLMGKTLEPGGSAYGYIYIDQPPTQFITISLD